MNLIPKPQLYVEKNDYCNLDNLIYYHVDDNISDSKEVIYSILKKGLKRELEDKKGKIDIIYNENIAKEGYILDVEKEYIKIEASDASGALYGIQSIRILGEFDLEEPTLQCCHIEDYPRYKWRGLLYDEARHFFGIEATLRLLDNMSLHKLNVLHWHLTDDNGWRIEIKKYPKLTQIGSKRTATQINGWLSCDSDETPHEGFYSQEEIKKVISYAKKLGIMIVPEIDMPAHFAAGIAAYNDLTCRTLDRPVPWYIGGTYPIKQGIKDWNRPVCISKPSTIEFLHNVLDEIFEIFDSPYFHVGGDECDMREWKQCPLCQAKMKELGFNNVNQLFCNFINGIQKYAKEHGKRLMGWNECLLGDALDNSVVVQYWTWYKDAKVKKHLENGGEVVLSKHQSFYFDMPYAQYQLKNTYNFNLSSLGINKSLEPQIKGIEGAMWTEWIPNMYKFDFHLYPRMEALSEVAWSNNNKNYREFLVRLEMFKPILDALKINYAENEICNQMGLLKKIKYKKKWYKGNQMLELNENAKLKMNKSINKKV